MGASTSRQVQAEIWGDQSSIVAGGWLHVPTPSNRIGVHTNVLAVEGAVLEVRHSAHSRRQSPRYPCKLGSMPCYLSFSSISNGRRQAQHASPGAWLLPRLRQQPSAKAWAPLGTSKRFPPRLCDFVARLLLLLCVALVLACICLWCCSSGCVCVSISVVQLRFDYACW